jgi:ribA/ribD-fused uncharacterized protein
MSDFEFSNFQSVPEGIIDVYDIIYGTVEHYYQASKSLSPGTRSVIAAQPTAARAKTMGRKIYERPDWSVVKDRVMMYGLIQKFDPSTDHAAKLLAFKGPIVEWNRWHDNYWGRCTCPRCSGLGQNRLGKMLEKIREELVYDEEIF